MKTVKRSFRFGYHTVADQGTSEVTSRDSHAMLGCRTIIVRFLHGYYMLIRRTFVGLTYDYRMTVVGNSYESESLR